MNFALSIYEINLPAYSR